LCCVLMTRNSAAGSDFMFLIYLAPFFLQLCAQLGKRKRLCGSLL
jgi:hypothetical protein